MDWKSLIADLKELGYSQPRIAAECDCGQATVNELATGKTLQPRYPLGVALTALHKRATAAHARAEKAGAR